MADFIAVIRRAVDGLTDNSPEMRLRVYDKARTAVQRQLENMKPRPPEEMLRRQMDKLESAIRQVEEEHSEALPPAEEIVVTVPPEIQTEPVYEAEPAYEPELQRQTDRAQEPEVESDSSFNQPAAQSAQIEEPANSWAGEEESEAYEDEARVEKTSVPRAMSGDDAAGSEQLAEAAEMSPIAAVVSVSAGFVPVQYVAAEPAVLDKAPEEAASVGEQEPREWPAEIDSEPEEWVEPDVEAHAEMSVPDLSAPQQPRSLEPNHQKPNEPEASTVRMPKASFDEAQALADFDDLLEQPVTKENAVVTPVRPTGRVEPSTSDFSWDAPFDDLPEHQTPVAFEDALAAKNAEIAEAQAARTADEQRGVSQAVPTRQPPAMPAASNEPEADLDELIGHSLQRPASSEHSKAAPIPVDGKRAVSKFVGRSFSTQPKQRGRGLIVVGLAAALSLLVAGGAFAVWYNFDKVNTLVSGLIASEQPVIVEPVGDSADKQAAVTPDTKVTDTAVADPATPVATGTDNVGAAEPAVTPVNPNPVIDAAEPDPNANTQIAAVEPADVGPQKFTQRLMANGSETKGDNGAVQVDAALPEGTSVAGQTVASASTGDTPAGTPETPAGDKPPVISPVAVTQKMFLYEERLGQSSPTAVTGTVAWSLKNETASDGKAEPVIVAQIEAPERGIKAMVSFKRNTDSSLPASHIIEIVFSLPKDFEGGNIESIERIAFKQNEQDRGNALIAVPAKITDDFHMIALNDDKDAVKNNTELLRTRSWIDIPITYRNGRRALITMEKGASGIAAFEKAMTEWSALGRTAGN